MPNNKTSAVKSVLSKTNLFQNFDDNQLEEISKHSELVRYGINSLVYEHSGDDQPVPLMVIATGCVGVVYHPPYNTEDMINTIIMPHQILGEFQFLGDRFPDNIKLVSLAKSSVVSIDSEYLTKFVEKNVNFYQNLAKALVEKLNANNSQIFLRHFTNSFRKKLCMYLYNIGIHSLWQRICSRANSNKFKIHIYWTANSLGQYLSTGQRSVGEQLANIIEAKAIEITWYDENYKKLKKIGIPDIKKIGTEGAKLRFNSPFQISVIDRNKLRDFFE